MILCSEVPHETPDSDDSHIHLSLGILSILLTSKTESFCLQEIRIDEQAEE